MISPLGAASVPFVIIIVYGKFSRIHSRWKRHQFTTVSEFLLT